VATSEEAEVHSWEGVKHTGIRGQSLVRNRNANTEGDIHYTTVQKFLVNSAVGKAQMDLR
jgi:hypothetical protein